MSKYLIVGTGGVGGTLGGFLALAGHDVTCIARGNHLAAFREHGLHLHSDLLGEHYLNVKACTAEEYNDTADVVLVCVKGYSIDSVKDVIARASRRDTLVLPILNVYGTGPRIGRLVPHATVIDGCIYIVGFVSGDGEITQMGTILNLVFGARPEQGVARVRLEQIAKEFNEAHITAHISDDINRDTFVKWSFISASACAGLYCDAPMGGMQYPGKAQDTFIALSRESEAIGRALGIKFTEDMVEHNLAVARSLEPQSTASMQKDIARGHQSEIHGLLFDMVALGEQTHVACPVYYEIAEHFAKYR